MTNNGYTQPAENEEISIFLYTVGQLISRIRSRV